MARIALALFSLIPSTALAATATLQWAMPTQNVDGSSIPLTGNGAIVQSKVEYGPCTAGGMTVENTVLVDAPLTTVTVNGFVGGETACFRVRVRNSYGIESDPSNVVSKTFDAPKPRPPVLLSTITVAYQIKMNSKLEIRLARRVGTIDTGTPCVDTPILTNKGIYYPVDPSYVRFTRTPRSSVVVTKCELV